MTSSVTTLQALRVPVTVALLAGWAVYERSRTADLVGSTGPAAGPELWAHSAGRVAVLAAVLVVLLVGRRRPHPWPVLLLKLVRGRSR